MSEMGGFLVCSLSRAVYLLVMMMAGNLKSCDFSVVSQQRWA
jgi:hypothetical protein